MRQLWGPTARSAGYTVLIIAAALFCRSPVAAGLGPEWTALSAQQASILFDAPGLADQRARYLRGESDDHSATTELALWSAAAASYPKALVIYVKLSPGHHYRNRRDPKLFIKSHESFAGKALKIGRRHSAGNSVGRVEFRRFGFDDVQCVGFAEYWGVSPGAVLSIGTRLLFGYYCADPGLMLSDETITAVAAGVDIKR